MKRFLPIALIVIAGFYAVRSIAQIQPRVQTAQALAVTVLPTSSPRATDTPVPSPTIGYQETAIIAQQTAMEAVRVNAAITAEFERRVQEQLQMTAESDRRYQEVLSWTQIAAGTSIPLTATQQAVINTQAVMEATQASAYVTGTADYPNVISRVADAEYQAQNKQVGTIMGWVIGVLFGGGLLLSMVVVLVVLFRPGKRVVEPEETEESEPVQETVIHLREDRGNGDFGQERFAVPCNSDQLQELALMVINGERNLAINRIETHSETLRRGVLTRLRKFFRMNNFAIELGDGEIALNDRAVCFLEGWFENHQLESGYTFSGEEA